MNKSRIVNPNNKEVRDNISRTTECVNLDGTLVSITYNGPTDGEIASGTSADSYVTNCTDAANCRGN